MLHNGLVGNGGCDSVEQEEKEEKEEKCLTGSIVVFTSDLVMFERHGRRGRAVFIVPEGKFVVQPEEQTHNQWTCKEHQNNKYLKHLFNCKSFKANPSLIHWKRFSNTETASCVFNDVLHVRFCLWILFVVCC